MSSNELDSQRAVYAVARVGPTFARGLDRLIGLDVNIRQGEPVSNMRLDFELSCGVAPLRVSGSNYEMALRSCFVSLQRENCDVQVKSKYEHWLDRGAFHEVQKTVSGGSGGAGFNVEAAVDPLKGVAGFAAKLGFRASRNVDSKSEASTETNTRTELVATSGHDRWRVGSPTRGDVRRPDGLLSGAYFREERTADDDPLPLCRLSCVDHSLMTQVTVTVSASFGSLVIFQSDGSPTKSEGTLQGAKTSLEDRSKRASIQHEKALRAHVAGFAAAKSIREAQITRGMLVAHNEFIAAQETLCVPPASSDDNDRP